MDGQSGQIAMKVAGVFFLVFFFIIIIIHQDSICSWISDPESVLNNWRGWRKQSSGANNSGSSGSNGSGANGSANGASSSFSSSSSSSRHLLSLTDLSAREVAASIPFELVEAFESAPVPPELQLKIAFWSFPEDEEDIRLYSCLANGSSEEFGKGESLFRAKAVKEPIQIGGYPTNVACVHLAMEYR